VVDDHGGEQFLNVRVKGRGDGEAAMKGRKMGGFFKDASSASLKDLVTTDSIKRPLTGLFRRPGSARPPSAAGKRGDQVDSIPVTATVTDFFVTPEIARREIPMVNEGVARAPSISVHRSANLYGYLDSVSRNPSLSKLENIDLSLLSRFLCPVEETKDEDVPWTWDYVFASVCSEMRAEWAMDEMDEEQETTIEMGRNADSLRMIA